MISLVLNAQVVAKWKSTDAQDAEDYQTNIFVQNVDLKAHKCFYG